ncbi:uncharacterized protein At2g23090-like [Hibiscus syriacus]|uniref:uncharacterized protein At2g23090-like n=1 Tax=Hibiscus syriacus TaxID=106335 RepID=UPI001922FE9C|nr:uncharacterized protein At2g23090-like [Hibiscus syriacus]
MAREKNLEKQKAAGKGSQLDSNKKAMTIQCKVCMQTFMCTTTEVKCREHARQGILNPIYTHVFLILESSTSNWEVDTACSMRISCPWLCELVP